MQEIKSCFVVI